MHAWGGLALDARDSEVKPFLVPGQITNGMVRRRYPASSWDVSMNGGGVSWSYTRSVLISARQSFIW